MASFQHNTELDEQQIIDIPEEILSSSENYDANFRSSENPTKFENSVSQMVWEAGKEQARNAYTFYANIDLLRTYFNVEPEQVRNRILESFVPRLPPHYSGKVFTNELYGPLMLVFTQIALLLYGMKSSDHVVREGTLMGTAFGLCFGYWLGAASLVYFFCYISNSRLSYAQILSMMGYGLSGHCLTLLLTTAIHPVHSHVFFYTVWLLLGGLTTTRLVFMLMSRTEGKSQRLLVCTTMALLHLLNLIYLHFSYHKTVEALDLI